MAIKRDKTLGPLRENDAVMDVVLLSGTNIPGAGKIYKYNPVYGDVVRFFTPEVGNDNGFEIWLTQASSAVTSFTFAPAVWWADDSGNFASTNTPPELTDTNTTYCLVFRFDGTRWLGNLAYKVA